MPFVPKGIIPAMVTPLTSDGKVNEKALRRLIDFLIDGGSHGLFVVGTTGEFYGLSPEEKEELFEITVDQTRGRYRSDHDQRGNPSYSLCRRSKSGRSIRPHTHVHQPNSK
jgi:hypothetical protein